MRLFKILYNKHNLKSNSFTNKALLICIVSIILCNPSVFAQRKSKDKVTLQLKWKNQFQFAGYYAALEKGYYAEAGIDLEIVEPKENKPPTQEVLNGDAQYGIGNSELVIQYMKGEPIVVLACIIQNSPSGLVVKSTSNIYTPKDFAGKTIEIDKDQSGIEIMAMLAKEDVKGNQIKAINTTYSLNNLLANKVDAIEIYTTNEPFFLDKFGIPYRLILPRNYGINFYSDCLFTTTEEVKSHPKRVRDFRDASIKGWKYAMEHPEEIVNIIQSKYKSTKTAEHLLSEAAEMRKLINPDFIEVGHSNIERWKSIVEILSQQGLIKQYKSIDKFVYNPHETEDSKLLFLSIIIVILTIGVTVLGCFTIKFRRKLGINAKRIKVLTQKDEQHRGEIVRLNKELKRVPENILK